MSHLGSSCKNVIYFFTVVSLYKVRFQTCQVSITSVFLRADAVASGGLTEDKRFLGMLAGGHKYGGSWIFVDGDLFNVILDVDCDV